MCKAVILTFAIFHIVAPSFVEHKSWDQRFLLCTSSVADDSESYPIDRMDVVDEMDCPTYSSPDHSVVVVKRWKPIHLASHLMDPGPAGDVTRLQRHWIHSPGERSVMWKPHYEAVLLRPQIKCVKLLNQQVACFVEGRVASDELGMGVQMTSGGNIVEAVIFEEGFWVYYSCCFFVFPWRVCIQIRQCKCTKQRNEKNNRWN